MARRLADHLCERFGGNPGQIHGYPGHPEIELALVKLYRLTHVEKYLALAQFFVEERGQQPNFFEAEALLRQDSRPYDLRYAQANAPIRDQREAEGHAVRAMYLFAGAADIAAETDDESLVRALETLWTNVTEKRMYVTGGIGASAHGEAFSADYDLPSDRAYAETCAAIGLVLWAQRMLQLETRGNYADVLERALYNGVLSGMSADGERYFYVNPLEVWPEAALRRHDMQATRTERQPWFGCACCPPNLARLLADLPQYLYGQATDGILIHLYASSTLQVAIDGASVRLRQETQYPWDGTISIGVEVEREASWTLHLRIPVWAESFMLSINQERVLINPENGYVAITRTWRSGDDVRLVLPMTIRPVYAHPEVRGLAGQVSLARGPLVYCFEEVDNGPNLGAVALDLEGWKGQWDENIAGGIVSLSGRGERRTSQGGDLLYRSEPWPSEPLPLRAVPYFAWGNRGPGEMRVWMSLRTS